MSFRYLVLLVPIGDEEKFAAYLEEQLPGSRVEMLVNTLVAMDAGEGGVSAEELRRVMPEWVTRRADRVYVAQEAHRSGDASVQELLEAMVDSGALEGLTLRLNCYPKKLENIIGDKMDARGVALHPTQFSHVLSVVRSNEGGRIFVGLTPADFLVGRASTRKGRASCASYKIEEALVRYRFPIDGVVNACDVGAAPGGWTDWMLDHGFKVWAVDPANIREATACKPGLTHVRSKVQECEEELLRDVPGGFQLVTCDMNVSTDVLIGLVPEFVRIAAPGAILLLTLKLSQLRGKQKQGKLVHNRSIEFDRLIAKDFPMLENLGTKYLISNRNERTVCLQLKKEN